MYPPVCVRTIGVHIVHSVVVRESSRKKIRSSAPNQPHHHKKKRCPKDLGRFFLSLSFTDAFLLHSTNTNTTCAPGDCAVHLCFFLFSARRDTGTGGWTLLRATNQPCLLEGEKMP